MIIKRIGLALFGLLLVSANAGATTVVVKPETGDAAGQTESHMYTDSVFTRFGLQVRSGTTPVCLISGEFLRANNIDGFQLRNVLFEGSWTIECTKVSGFTEGAIVDRISYVRN